MEYLCELQKKRKRKENFKLIPEEGFILNYRIGKSRNAWQSKGELRCASRQKDEMSSMRL